MVILIVQKTVLFVYLLIVKKAKLFSSLLISFYFFVVYFEPSCLYLNLAIFLIARLNRCYEPRDTVQENLNHVTFSIARLNRRHEPRGTVQEHLNLAIFSITRLTSPCIFEPCASKANCLFNFFQLIFSRGKIKLVF